MYVKESTVLSRGKGIQEHKEKAKMPFTKESLVDKIVFSVCVYGSK